MRLLELEFKELVIHHDGLSRDGQEIANDALGGKALEHSLPEHIGVKPGQQIMGPILEQNQHFLCRKSVFAAASQEETGFIGLDFDFGPGSLILEGRSMNVKRKVVHPHIW